MKSHYSLSDQQLRDYAQEHIQYEIDMLAWSASILAFLSANPSQGTLPINVRNGLLNSFALHARNLINFLYGRSRGSEFDTDIVVQDYIDDKTVSQHLLPITPLLTEALTKANKQAAHLSLDRIAYEQEGKAWSFIDISRDILAALASIAPYFPESRLTTSLRDKISRSGFVMPIIDVAVDDFPSGQARSLSLSLRIGPDGKSIMAISA